MKTTFKAARYLFLISLFMQLSCSSEDGTDGEIGSQGEIGLQGLLGEIGPAGEDGSAILAGNGQPTNDLGEIGDLYLDKDTGALYGPKIDNTNWGASISLGTPNANNGENGADGQNGEDGENGQNGEDGENGTNGSQIFAGDAPPENTLGVDGDYYLDKITFNLYGPKTADEWSTPISLKGTTDVRYTDWFNYVDDLSGIRDEDDFIYRHIKTFGFMGNDFLDNGGSVLVYRGFVITPNLGNIPIRPTDIFSLPWFVADGVHQWKESFRHEASGNTSGSVTLTVEVSNTQGTTRASFLTDIFNLDQKFFRIIFIPGGTLVNKNSKTPIDYSDYEAVKKYYGIKD